MDGSPSRGETIPIRLFLGGFDLTPTFRDVNKKFSTRYYLSLVLIDEGEPDINPFLGEGGTEYLAPHLPSLFKATRKKAHSRTFRCTKILQTV